MGTITISQEELYTHNLRYYVPSMDVPKEAQKSFTNGRFNGTDINPMWRIKKLTELFGPAGIGWYTEVISEKLEPIDKDNVLALVDINLYVKENGEWSKPIFGTGGNTFVAKGRISDEGFKMAYTDALSVACKALGIGAKIYWDADKTKYTIENTDTTPQPKSPPKKDEPAKITAVVEFTANPEDVPQNLLTALVESLTKGKSRDEKLAIAAEIKKFNGGNAQYTSIGDPQTRKQIYTTLYKKYMTKED